MADSKLTALTELSVPALDHLAYIVDTATSYKVTQARLGGLYLPSTCQGRLTTESGVPVSTTDRTAQSTIYFTPYVGDRVALYDGTRWKLYAFTERSLALSSLTASLPYDVYLYDNAGTLTLELTAWTNGTTLAVARVAQDGVLVKAGATTRRYVGTIYTTGTSTTEDSRGGTTTQVGGRRFVWNAQHQVPRPFMVIDTADNWSYSTNTVRQANNASGNKVECVVGLATAGVANVHAVVFLASNGSVAAKAGVGVDSTTAFSGLVQGGYTPGQLYAPVGGVYRGPLTAGYHYFAWLEKGADGSTCTFLGDNGGDSQQAGLVAEVWG